MKHLKYIYLTLAIVGTVLPYFYFIPFFAEFGFDLPMFISLTTANTVTQGMSADIVIASVVFWVYMAVQFKNANAPNPLLFVALNLCIGLSCALPAYLYVVELRKTHTKRD